MKMANCFVKTKIIYGNNFILRANFVKNGDTEKMILLIAGLKSRDVSPKCGRKYDFSQHLSIVAK